MDMSLSPLDANRGTGPLPALDAIMAAIPALESAIDKAIAKLDNPRGAGTRVLQGYEDDPFLLVPTDEAAADGEAPGQLVMQWQPPSEEAAWDELRQAKEQTAAAARERVVLGATGTPVRVVGV
jgi:hypothetical protein